MGSVTTEPTEKQCRGCGETKSLDSFYKTGRSSRGRTARCKHCLGVSQAARFKANYEKIKVVQDAWRRANPEKVRASSARRLLKTKRDRHEARIKRMLETARLVSLSLKMCRGCKEIKALEDFSKNKSSKDGLGQCTACRRKVAVSWLEKNADRAKAARRVWYENNKEKVAIDAAAWKAAHPEKVKQIRAKWLEHNPEKRKEVGAAWVARNREKHHANVLKRRARRRKAGGQASMRQIQARVEYYGGLCYLCSKPYEEIDHVIPLARGGTGWPANMRPACRPCNRRKRDQLPEIRRLPDPLPVPSDL